PINRQRRHCAARPRIALEQRQCFRICRRETLMFKSLSLATHQAPSCAKIDALPRASMRSLMYAQERDRQLRAEILARLGGTIDEARHLPGHVYTSPEFYELEKDRIFMKDWLCIARVEEVEKTGDYLTTDIMGEPVIIVRDQDGAIGAFANV